MTNEEKKLWIRRGMALVIVNDDTSHSLRGFVIMKKSHASDADARLLEAAEKAEALLDTTYDRIVAKGG
jgi:hypothetical protein